jgi:hypothetical protein
MSKYPKMIPSWWSWCISDLSGKHHSFPLPTKDVEPEELQINDIYTKRYHGETDESIHLYKIIKINKKTLLVRPCDQHGNMNAWSPAPDKGPRSLCPYRVLDY